MYKGFFKAPASTDYRFYVSVDDQAKIYLSTDNDPANMALIFSSTKVTPYNNKFVYPEQVSSWVTLTAGQMYYMEARQWQFNGGESFSVAVEI